MMGPATIYFATGGVPFQAEVAHLDSGVITATGSFHPEDGDLQKRVTRSWPMTAVKSVRWHVELEVPERAA